MVSDELGKQLHDHATRGETLSVEEQRQLDRWYTAQDHAEMAMLNLDTATKIVTSLQSSLRSKLLSEANIG
jgi:hypothetical protein